MFFTLIAVEEKIMVNFGLEQVFLTVNGMKPLSEKYLFVWSPYQILSTG